MDSGKSTLALQLDFTMRGRGKLGRRYTKLDRKGDVISSRIGLSESAIPVTEYLDLYCDISSHLPLEYIICDEAQFYGEDQIDQLSRAVDELNIDVYAFGILSDFTGSMFPGARRLFEQADHRLELPVPALCWCGRRATHNARVINDVMVVSGEVVDPTATYHVVCRKHFNRHEAKSPATTEIAGTVNR
jgi:thymidine kinase